MDPVRVALLGLPAMLGDIVRAVIEQDPALRIVDRTTQQVDVVVCTTEGPIAGDTMESLLNSGSSVRVVVIAVDGRSAYVCTPTGELSPVALRDAIHGR
ncbi:hypothetical protein QLQ12_36510 [Actinoplanes sp. NEAU-A12]|uniref:Uncharacterized protein n=1 Tax=Actinoplanes sandaracinus TaxID=3045177 RepID=A0ABT6WWI4_9ACTN|nr:hypothetical protein [Actinoplanes sandaracinus]MDI6104109.1 hypothetical protein [Actinoplanes sandaracinus]